MEITDVRITLVNRQETDNDRLKAFVSITFDDAFVVRDLKVVDGETGLFVAMPSRKLTDHCPRCHQKNPLQSRYCSSCGTLLGEHRSLRDTDGREKLHADIAHPISIACRAMIQTAVLRAYAHELERAIPPGYCTRFSDADEDVRGEASQP